MCNILRIHMHACLQPGIAKSSLLNVQEILLAREQRAAANVLSPCSAAFPSQPRDQIDSWRAADKIKQIQNGETTVTNEDNLPIRRPSSDQLDNLPCAIGQPLMPALLHAARGPAVV